MRKTIIAGLLLSYMVLPAQAITNSTTQEVNKIITIVPNGLLTSSPIISDETFAKIAKKNNLSEKNFTSEDLKKLDNKFNKVVEVLKTEKVFDEISQIAPKYGVAPETVAACIIGEHVFNVSIADSFQSYFVNIYSKWIDKHNSIQHVYLQLLKEPDIKSVLDNDTLTDYEKWDSIFNIYNQKYRNTKNYPDSNFIFTFFNPYGAGLTYGLGQLSPIRVLLTNDIAVKMGGLPKINPTDTDKLYFATLDVDTNINYVAATVVASIENYKKYANFDISHNIGVIATLYNLGEEKKRAKKLAKNNEILLKNNKTIQYPQENFYGWYMNKKESEVKKLVSHTK